MVNKRSSLHSVSSPGHESANLGPSAFCNEETHNRVGHCTPSFTDEQHHGGLEGVNLWSAARTDFPTELQTIFIVLIVSQHFTWATSSRYICRKKAVALAATSLGAPPMAKHSLLLSDNFWLKSVCEEVTKWKWEKEIIFSLYLWRFS